MGIENWRSKPQFLIQMLRPYLSFELKWFITHHFHVLIVTTYRTLVLPNPLICPVEAGFLATQIASSNQVAFKCICSLIVHAS